MHLRSILPGFVRSSEASRRSKTTRLRLDSLEGRDIPSGGYFRIVSYNIASSSGAPRTGLDTILQGISNEHVNGRTEQLDAIALQEVESQATTTQDVANLLNAIYGAGVYKAGTVNGASTGSGTQGLVYNSQTLQLVGTEVTIGTATTTGQPRQALRYKLHPVGYPSTADFYLYDSHYKADSDATSQMRRQDEAVAIRADSDALGNVAILYTGDFNSYSSSETFYQTLLGAGSGQANDPVNRPGAWHNTATFVDIDTQAPANTPPAPLTGGGLDDRFDFQLNSGELNDHVGLDYVAGTYHTFGNNGSVALNGDINDATNTALPDLANRTTILDLETTVTDHLPVVADYRVVVPPAVSSVQINGGAAQRSRVASVKVDFTQIVSLPATPANAFQLIRQSDNAVVGLTASVMTDTATHVTLTFTGAVSDFGSLQDGRYTLTVLANLVSNANGSLDGNGDFTGGDNYVLASDASPAPPTHIFRFFGDLDGDGDTDAANFLSFRDVLLGILPYDPALDFDNSGSVDAADFLQFRNRYLLGSI